MAEHEEPDRRLRSGRVDPADSMRHALVAKLLSRTTDPQRAHIIDLGCGTGELLARLHRLLPGAKLLGVDAIEPAVAAARQCVPDASFVVADVFHPPAELKRFHQWATAAVCCETLAHVDSPVGFLRAGRAYLKQNARIIVTVPGGPLSAGEQRMRRRHFTRISIIEVLALSGFEVERVYLSGFPFFNVYRTLEMLRDTPPAADEKLAMSGGEKGGVSSALFRGLFLFNLMHFPAGWQIVAVARNSGVTELSPFRALQEADIAGVELEPGTRLG